MENHRKYHKIVLKRW